VAGVSADPFVVAVARDGQHRFSKDVVDEIRLLAGLGVEGDAHCGRTVQHLSRVRRQPGAPNLRQVHLVAAELLDELSAAGFEVAPGRIGENVTTRGVDLIALPRGTRLTLGADAVVEVTGLRNPCVQLDRYQDGLMGAVLDRDADGELIRRAGVMGVVVSGGMVRPGDPIAVAMPAGARERLLPV
jgi:MOSC domain-containing protein YiiM